MPRRIALTLAARKFVIGHKKEYPVALHCTAVICKEADPRINRVLALDSDSIWLFLGLSHE